jgi:ABC-type glycerol-3-phosphate transport system substrate-binding protein
VATVANTANPKKVKLVIGWWGEQEAPSMSKWLDESIAMFEKTHPNVEIEQAILVSIKI